MVLVSCSDASWLTCRRGGMLARRDKQRPRRPNPTGRNDRGPNFVSLPWPVLESAAFASLDLTARALLVEVVHLYKGDNNGSLYLSAREARDRLGLGDCRPVLRGFEDLQDRGFLELAKEAHFAVKASDTSRARVWRITWHAWLESPVKARRAPTNDWRNYQPPGGTRSSKRADKRLRALARYRKEAAAGRLPVVNFTTIGAKMPHIGASAVVKSTTANPESDAIPPFLVVGDSTTHIDDTMGRGLVGWWATPAEAQIWVKILLLSVVGQNRPLLAKAA